MIEEDEPLLTAVSSSGLMPVPTADGSLLGATSPDEPLAELLPPEVRKREARKLIYFMFICGIPILSTQVAVYDMLYDVACREYGVARDVCSSDPEISKIVSNYLSVSAVISAILSMIAVPFLSALSDRWGRRPIILMCMWLFLLGLGGFAVLPYGVPARTTHWRLICIDIIVACTGNGVLLFNGVTLIVMDLLPEVEVQARYMSFLAGSINIASALIGLIMGPFYIYVGYTKFVNLLFFSQLLVVAASYLIVPESETTQDRAKAEESMSVKRMIEIAWFMGDEISTQTKWNGRVLVICSLMGMEFSMGLSTAIELYGKQHFGWTGKEIGWSQSLIASVRSLYSMLGFPLLYNFMTKHYGEPSEQTVWRPDIWLLQLSQFMDFIGYFLMGASTDAISYVVGIFINSNQYLCGPLHTTTQLRLIDPGNRGEFMAARGFLITVASAVIPSLLLKFYSMTIDVAPQLIFILTGSLSMLVFGGYFFIRAAKLETPISVETPAEPGAADTEYTDLEPTTSEATDLEPTGPVQSSS